VIRATRYAVKPMSVEDAALRVESGPDTFLVFRNAETDSVTILYRRKDGNLGLIEPDS
jgi:ribosome hibernation promoting factor